MQSAWSALSLSRLAHIAKTDMKTARFSWWNVTLWLARLCSAWYLLSCWHTDGPTETVSHTSWPVFVTCLGTRWDLQGYMRGARLSGRIHGHKLVTTFLSYNPPFCILWLTLSLYLQSFLSLIPIPLWSLLTPLLTPNLPSILHPKICLNFSFFL